jgi:hypothetical protein
VATWQFAFLGILISNVAYGGPPSCGAIHPVAASVGTSILSKVVQTNPRTAAENGVVLFGIYIPYTCVATGIGYMVATADNTTNNHYGFGLVCASGCGTVGTLVAQTGSQTGTTVTPSSGTVNLAWNGSPVTLQPGVYALAVGTDCTSSGCAVLHGDADAGMFYAFIAAANSANAWTFDSTNGFPNNFQNMPAVRPVTVAGGATRLPTTPNFILY